MFLAGYFTVTMDTNVITSNLVDIIKPIILFISKTSLQYIIRLRFYVNFIQKIKM